MIQQEIDENAIRNLMQSQFGTLDPRVKNKIEPIHPQIDFYYNSFNICLGKQGSGKTTFMMYELIKLSQIDSLYQGILYIAPTCNDFTFNTLKTLIGNKIPIFHCTFEDSIQTLTDYFEKFKEGINHLFIIIEDATFLLNKENTIWYSWICSLRHLRATIWANLHIWKGINPTLKSQITSVFVMKGFSRDNMQYVYRQSSIDRDFNAFYIIYTTLKEHQVLSINNITNKLEIIN